MTPEEQRIAIAEACGWTRSDESYPYPSSPNGICKRIVWRNPRGEPQPLGDDAVPNYTGDLNAMHDAEKVLDEEQWKEYRYVNLAWMIHRDIRGSDFYRGCEHATAAQRAEAFLKTIGKWKDQPSKEAAPSFPETASRLMCSPTTTKS